jgi:hypothetical protein
MPGIVADGRLLDFRVATVVVVQATQLHAGVAPDVRTHVVARTIVDFREDHALLATTVGIGADTPEQRCLPIVQREAAQRDDHARRIVPAEYRGACAVVEAAAVRDAQVLEFIADANRAQLFAHPGVQRRAVDGVGVGPAGGAMLQ